MNKVLAELAKAFGKALVTGLGVEVARRVSQRVAPRRPAKVAVEHDDDRNDRDDDRGALRRENEELRQEVERLRRIQDVERGQP
jgi:hypothetical protein